MLNGRDLRRCATQDNDFKWVSSQIQSPNLGAVTPTGDQERFEGCVCLIAQHMHSLAITHLEY
eukprot:741972-Pyramimonas_sp.AAC.1